MMWPLRLLESRAETCFHGLSQAPCWGSFFGLVFEISLVMFAGRVVEIVKLIYWKNKTIQGQEERRKVEQELEVGPLLFHIISQRHSAGMHASAAKCAARSILGDTKAKHDFQERQQKERESLRLCTVRWMVCGANLSCYCWGGLVCLCTFSLNTYYWVLITFSILFHMNPK